MFVITDNRGEMQKFFIGLTPDREASLSDKLCWSLCPTWVPIEHGKHAMRELHEREGFSAAHPILCYGQPVTIVFTPYQIGTVLELVRAWNPYANKFRKGPTLYPNKFVTRKISFKKTCTGVECVLEDPDLKTPPAPILREQHTSSLRPAYHEPHPSPLQFAGRMMQRT